MKYPVMSAQPQYVYKAALPDGGIIPNNFTKDEKHLTESENIWFSDNQLCTRPGLTVDSYDPACKAGNFDFIWQKLTFTGVRVMEDGIEKELAYYLHCLDNTHIAVYTYLVDKSKNYTSLGEIMFTGMFVDTFFVPDRLLFLSAGATSGCGIYAFVKTIRDEKEEYAIYECNSERNGWIRHYSSDYYVPTIYINGRGTLFDEVVDAYSNKPIELEQQNLLTGQFKAYFSSDGHSSVFKLPVSNLDDDVFICRVYQAPNDYAEWLLDKGESTKVSDLFGGEVTLTLDRTSGMFSFTSNGEAHPIMKMSRFRSNNIYVFASKTVDKGLETVLGSTVCENFNSFIVLSGSEVDRNAVVLARCSRPLYFPKGAITHVGDSESAVTALKTFGNRLLCFKSDGIYRISLTNGSVYSDNEMLLGVQTDFYKSDTVKNELLYYDHGCIMPKSICVCDNKLIWMDTSHRICLLKSTDSRIKTLSAAVSSKLHDITAEKYETIVGSFNDGYYILWYGNHALAAHISDTDEKTAWYGWKFPDSIKVEDVAEIGGVLRLIVGTGTSGWCHFAELSKGYDLLPDSNEMLVRSDISSCFSTARFDFGCPWLRKAVDSVFIEASSPQSIEISFDNEESSHRLDIMMDNDKAEKHITATYRVRPGLYGVNDVSVTVKSNQPFSVGGLMFCYRKLSEVSGI